MDCFCSRFHALNAADKATIEALISESAASAVDPSIHRCSFAQEPPTKAARKSRARSKVEGKKNSAHDDVKEPAAKSKRKPSAPKVGAPAATPPSSLNYESDRRTITSLEKTTTATVP